MCEFHLNKKKAKKERKNPIPNKKNSQVPIFSSHGLTKQ